MPVTTLKTPLAKNRGAMNPPISGMIASAAFGDPPLPGSPRPSLPVCPPRMPPSGEPGEEEDVPAIELAAAPAAPIPERNENPASTRQTTRVNHAEKTQDPATKRRAPRR